MDLVDKNLCFKDMHMNITSLLFFNHLKCKSLREENVHGHILLKFALFISSLRSQCYLGDILVYQNGYRSLTCIFFKIQYKLQCYDSWHFHLMLFIFSC